MPGWSVSSLCPHHCQDPFKSIHELHIKGHHSQWCPPILSGFCMVIEIPLPLREHTHLPTLKQVSWLISDTNMEWHINTNLNANSSFWFLLYLSNTASSFTLFSSLYLSPSFHFRGRWFSNIKNALLWIFSLTNSYWSWWSLTHTKTALYYIINLLSVGHLFRTIWHHLGQFAAAQVVLN